jgi:hypothetical protein
MQILNKAGLNPRILFKEIIKKVKQNEKSRNDKAFPSKKINADP